MNRLLIFILLLCLIAIAAPRALRTANCVDFNKQADVTFTCIKSLDRGTGYDWPWMR